MGVSVAAAMGLILTLAVAPAHAAPVSAPPKAGTLQKISLDTILQQIETARSKRMAAGVSAALALDCSELFYIQATDSGWYVTREEDYSGTRKNMLRARTEVW